MNIFSSMFLTLFRQFPVTAVWIIGLVLSLVYWRKHPKVSLLSLIAIVGFFATSFMNAYINIRLPALLTGISSAQARFNFISTMSSFITSLTTAVFWAMLGAAIFGWRSKQETSGNALELEKDQVEKSKLHRLGIVSLVLSVLLILIVLGTFTILIYVGSATSNTGDMNGFWTGLFGISAKMLFLPFWGLPLGILNIILASKARKTDSSLQKTVAVLGITVGTIALIISLWLLFYLYIFFISYR